jgi:outer membrane protein OmpA-like peptidoglycan-associated protein
VLALVAVAGTPTSAHAQFGKRLKDALKRNAEDKAIQKATNGEDKAIDAATKSGTDTTKAATDTTKAATSPAAPPTAGAAAAPAATPTAAPPAATAAAAPASATGAPATLKPGEGAWANYDFKPGDRVLYSEDFSADEVGDFPKRMEFKAGGLEIVEWQGARYLRANQDSKFYLVLPEVLPDRFTMEFDYTIPSGGEVWIYFQDKDDRYAVFGGLGSAGVRNQPAGISSTGAPAVADQNASKIRRARIMGDGKYLKLYLDDTRVANVPNADLGRSNKILFYTDADASKPTLFGNFRVAAGGKKLYEALTEKGRVATQGIYFDTGSDRIRPESTPTLKEIGSMLKDHADLKLSIEGHTDNVGQADANQALSEKRAAAVRQFLIDSYGIDGSRLQAKGLGQTKPVASNDTPEGRQSNRRVELVKS